MLPVGFDADGTLTISPGLMDVPKISCSCSPAGRR
jgi:hypothetical protein